jgi:DHA1 family bicyclomycin/chloramphenicol resistance-like MFS transporter
MALFSTVSLLATFAANFGQMVLMRLVQGMAAASSRVLAVSLLRDRYSGQEMARITSFVFVVFLAVPILAPSLGQIILYSGPWAWIFYFLAAFGGALMIWAGLRLPETLAPGFRRPLSFRALIDGSAMVLRNRRTMGYTIAQMLMFGTLIGFINSAQQIFEQVLHRPAIFAYVFAGCASSMSIGSLLNARLVGRWGARRVSQAALAAFLALSLVHLIFASVRNETLVSFALLQMATMFWFPMTGANFAAMAMEPMAAIAGTASSIQGTISTVGGALAGLLISQSFDRSTVPLARGFVICASLACCLIWWIEYGSRSHGSGADATTAR